MVVTLSNNDKGNEYRDAIRLGSTPTPLEVVTFTPPGFIDQITDGTDGDDIIPAQDKIFAVFGNGGDDTIIGGGSPNKDQRLIGGTGADVFVPNQIDSSDGKSYKLFVGDFEEIDRIDLSDTNITSISDLVFFGAIISSNVDQLSFVILPDTSFNIGNLSAKNFIFKEDAPIPSGTTASDKYIAPVGSPAFAYSGLDGNDTIVGSENNDTLRGNKGDDSILANLGDDNVRGGKGNDFINGNDGNDVLFGDLNNDTIRGGKADDTIHGGKDNDFVNGDLGNDSVYGDKGDDIVRGGKGEDHLFGGIGNDSLFGDRGNDTLVGGDGFDRFVFDNFHGHDIIVDFESGVDKLVILRDDILTAEQLLALFNPPGTVFNSESIINFPDGASSITFEGITSIDINDIMIGF